MKQKHIIFLHVWKAIDPTIILALSYFWNNFLLLTDEYLSPTVLDCKVIDPQATTLSYVGDSIEWYMKKFSEFDETLSTAHFDLQIENKDYGEWEFLNVEVITTETWTSKWKEDLEWNKQKRCQKEWI